jgi:hypothetical protein
MTDQFGALIVEIAFDGIPLDEWIDWYDTEHIPERKVMPGWLNGRRWMAADGRNTSLGVYDLESIDALHSVEYQAILDAGQSPWTKRMHRLRNAPQRPSKRYECVQINPGDQRVPEEENYLLVVRLDVDPALEDAMNSWYDEEHLPLLAAVPGVTRARRFRAANADDRLCKYLALYHLDSPDVSRTEQWRAASRTPRALELGPSLRNLEFTMFARPDLVSTATVNPGSTHA